MDLYEYLRGMREDMPAWLQDFRTKDAFESDEFLSSRVVYYPGSGTDGHPVKVFGSTHAAHCFVYADYSTAQADLEAELIDPQRRFRGYHTLCHVRLAQHELLPRSWTPHVEPAEIPAVRYRHASTSGFGLLKVLERDHGLGERHGPGRLAILFLGADGIATYDALFCQRDSMPPPFAAVVQDHGTGGNYDRFGGGGLLERIATRCAALPRLLLVAENSTAWNGYTLVPGLAGDRGGMHSFLRSLYER